MPPEAVPHRRQGDDRAREQGDERAHVEDAQAVRWQEVHVCQPGWVDQGQTVGLHSQGRPHYELERDRVVSGESCEQGSERSEACMFSWVPA